MTNIRQVSFMGMICAMLVIFSSSMSGHAVAPHQVIHTASTHRASTHALPGIPPFDCSGCCEWDNSCKPGCNDQGCEECCPRSEIRAIPAIPAPVPMPEQNHNPFGRLGADRIPVIRQATAPVLASYNLAVMAPASMPISVKVQALPGLPPFDCVGCCEYNNSCAPGCNDQGCHFKLTPQTTRWQHNFRLRLEAAWDEQRN